MGCRPADTVLSPLGCQSADGGMPVEPALLHAGRAVAPERQPVINHSQYYPVQLFFSGPAVLLILISILASLTLFAVFQQRIEIGLGLLERSAQRLEGRCLVPMLWGIAAAIVCVVAAALLISTKILALLGVLVLGTGLVLASLGLGAAALWLGTKISTVMGMSEHTSLPHLKLGLASMLLAALLPYVGWLLVLLALAAGIGAVLENLAVRRGGTV